LKSIEELLRSKGGRLDLASVPGTARSHLEQALLQFSPFLQPLVAPVKGFAGTRVTPPSRVSRFEFVRRWQINAAAAHALEHPVVLFNAGTPFVLFELFHSLMALSTVMPDLSGSEEADRPSIFRPPPDSFEHILAGHWAPLVPIPPDEIERLRSSGIANPPTFDGVSWRHYLPVVPRSSSRSSLALHLYMTALTFLFFHELGHIEEGHLEFLDRHYEITDLAEFHALDDTPQVVVDGEILQALEIEADLYALSHTLPVLLADVATIGRLGVRAGEEPWGAAERYRVWLVAIGTLFLFLDRNARVSVPRWKFWEKEASYTHPTNLTRMFYLLSRSLDHSNRQRKDVGNFAAVFSTALGDLQAVAKAFGTNARLTKAIEGLSAGTDPLAGPMKKGLDVEDELNDCKKAVANRYYLEGEPIDEHDYYKAARPTDTLGLQNQAVIHYFDAEGRHVEEGIRIEFLDFDAPTEEFLLRAANYERAGFLDNAIADLLHVLIRDKTNRAAIEQKDRIFGRIGESLPIIIEFLRKFGPESHFADILAKRAQANIASTGDLRGNLDFLSAAISVRPRSGLYRTWRARVWQLIGEREKAVADYTKALDLNIDTPTVYVLVNRGYCFASQGHRKDALADYNEALSLEPENVQALAQRAELAIDANELDQAWSDISLALQKESALQTLYLIRARIFSARRDTRSALDDLKRAIELDSDNPEPFVARATISLHDKNYKDAIADLTTAIGLNRGDRAYMFYHRSLAHFRLGELAEAIVDVDQALALEPPWADTAHRLRAAVQSTSDDARGNEQPRPN
jgi:tetratricopeptide (TPR) repeat protein